MRAIRVHQFGGPEQLVVEDVPDPRPAAGQILVQVHAAGVNPVDTYIRTGTHAVKPQLPYTPGFDGAGVVTEVGAGVTTTVRGARVYIAGSVTGTYADQAICLPSQVHRLPDRCSFAQGAAIGIPYATAYRALFQAVHARAGETVLVHGASGGVGVAAVQLAHAAGMTVIGTASTSAGRALVQEQGAHDVLDHSTDIAEAVAGITGGRGVDVIVEMLANRNLGSDLRLLARGGRVAVVGSRGPIEINPRDLMNREGTIHGVMVLGASPQEQAAIHAALVAALEVGSARPVIARELPLDHAREAHESIGRPGTLGKIVLRITGGGLS